MNSIRNLVFFFFVLRITRKTWWQLKGRGLIGTLTDLYKTFYATLYSYFLRIPGVSGKVRAEVAKSIDKLEKSMVPQGEDVQRHRRLPKDGWSHDKVREELKKLGEMSSHSWEEGKVSGAVYHGGKELMQLQTEAYGMFTVTNPLHPDVFPGVRKMEAEVVAMVRYELPSLHDFSRSMLTNTKVLSLFNAPESGAGTTTSGGTESIIMACLSARQKAYTERGVTEPEMIVPDTAHAAFLKAGEYFKIKVHIVECPAPSHKVSIRAVSRLINPNTILLVGSAPNFPHGVIDDISALSRLALRKQIPLHVDCCLGSFLVPYLEKAGYESEPFDFRLKGVTSISCDTHKYGFAPKGSSTILYRSSKLRSYQYYVSADWPGGVYASPSIAGSRPGALIAGCWASMMAQGEDGYVDACHKIVGCAKRIEDAVRSDPSLSADLEIVGKPMVSVVAFKSSTINIYHLADGMAAKGWHLNSLQSPPAVHIAVTLPVMGAAEQLVTDLRDVLGDIRKGNAEGRKPATGNSTALYGVAGSLPDKSIVKELAHAFLNTLYKV